MGVKAVRRALEDRSVKNRLQRAVLVDLAEHAKDDTLVCWPAVETIADEVGAEPRSVRRAIRALEHAGVVETEEHGAPVSGRRQYRPNLYRVLVGTVESPLNQVSADRTVPTTVPAVVSPETSSGDRKHVPVGTVRSPKPEENRIKKSTHARKPKLTLVRDQSSGSEEADDGTIILSATCPSLRPPTATRANLTLVVGDASPDSCQISEENARVLASLSYLGEEFAAEYTRQKTTTPLDLCQLLADLVEKHSGTRPPVTTAWRRAANQLVAEHGAAEVKASIYWTHEDSFWRTVVKSMPKLLEHYERLRRQVLGQVMYS